MVITDDGVLNEDWVNYRIYGSLSWFCRHGDYSFFLFFLAFFVFFVFFFFFFFVGSFLRSFFFSVLPCESSCLSCFDILFLRFCLLLPLPSPSLEDAEDEEEEEEEEEDELVVVVVVVELTFLATILVFVEKLADTDAACTFGVGLFARD